MAMVSGDPGYYSLLDALRRDFPAKQIMVIPGISAMQYAFARLALPWHDAVLASFHGRPPAAQDIAISRTASAISRSAAAKEPAALPESLPVDRALTRAPIPEKSQDQNT